MKLVGDSSAPDSAFERPQSRHWYWLVAGLLGLLLFALGTRGLNEPDEGRYANIARAMALSGDWWEPRMSGFAHYDKPPLIYWTTALSFKLFGFHEWAARLPSLLGAIATLAGLGWAAWRLYDSRTAWWAVLICGTSVQLFILARILSPDMLLTGWCALAIGAWAEARRAFRWRWWSLSVLFWALAWWTKATPAFVPLAGLAIGVALTRDRAGWRALRLPFLFLAVLALGSIWYLSMLHRYPELREFFFGRELAGRMTGHVHGRRGSPLYYLGVSLVAWLPWWPVVVKAACQRLAQLWASASPRWEKLAALRVETWIVLSGLAIFSAASSKLPTYTLPLMPWAALIFARLLVTRAVSNHSRWPTAPLVAAGAFTVVALVAVSVAPRYETRLGVNSSLREICRVSQAGGPRRLYCDRYWPGCEFYLDESRVRYLVEDDRIRERASDPGRPAGLFLSPRGDDWRTLPADDPLRTSDADVWLVRFRKQKGSPFAAWTNAPSLAGTVRHLGQFSLIPARVHDGRIVPATDAPAYSP